MHEWKGVLPLKKMVRHIGHLSPPGRDGLGEGAAHPAQPDQGSLTRCQKSPSPRSSFPHRDPLRRWRSNSRRGSSGSGGTEGQRATTAGGARGQRLGGLTMVDASPGAAPYELGSPATPAGGRRRRARPWRPQRFAAPRSGAKPRRRGRLRVLRGLGRWLRRCCSQGRGDGQAAGAGGGQPSAGCGRRRGPAEVPRTISRLAAGCPRGAPGRPSGAPSDALQLGAADRARGERRSPRAQCRAAVRRAETSAAPRPAPQARERGAARGAAEALTPPAPSAARTGGARGRGRRSSPSRLLGRRGSRGSRREDVGHRYEPEARGL